MKKIVLAFVCSLVAYTGSSSLKGSLLVNTVSFADLPDASVKSKVVKQKTTVQPVPGICFVPEKDRSLKRSTCEPKTAYISGNCSKKS